MRENQIALTFINRIGLDNLRKRETLESIKECLFKSEFASPSPLHTLPNSGFKSEPDALNAVEKKVSFRDETPGHVTDMIHDGNPVEVQLLEHLSHLRRDSARVTQDSSFANDLKSKSLLFFAKNLLVEHKRKSSWYSVLDDRSESEEYSFEGIDRLFALVVALARLEKYTNSDSIAVQVLANNVLLGFRYTFQSETSNLSVVQHPEWAVDYMKECVKRYMVVFKKVRNDLKVDTVGYLRALVPHPYSEDPALVEEFSLLCAESNLDEIASSWCMYLAKEARLFAYSRLPFLVYEYFLENDQNPLSLNDLTRVIADHNKSTVLEVSRSSFADEKVTSVLYALIGSLASFGLYLRGLDQALCFELFSDFDNNTLVPFIMIQFYNLRDDLSQLNADPLPESEGVSKEEVGSEPVEPYDQGEDSRTEKTEGHRVKSKVLLCFESNILFGCLDALLALESVHLMSLSKRAMSLDSFSDSIGVRTGLNAEMYLQDDLFFAQVSGLITSLLGQVERRCQCLKLVDSKRQYVSTVVVPLLDYFVDNVKYIWNSLDNVLESCTIACLLLESATSLQEFLRKFPLSEFMPESLSSLETITQKMVGIFDQYFMDLYYDPFRGIHRQHLEVIDHIEHKLLELCALCTYKNYRKILGNTITAMERLLVSLMIPARSIEFFLAEEEEVETVLGNCQHLLQAVKRLVEPKEFQETMQQLQDMVVILSMETVELKTSAEYLNLLGTTRMSTKTTSSEDKGRESQPKFMDNAPGADSFVSGVIFDQFEGDYSEDIHDSLIVAKIKQKLRIRKLSLSQTYTLILHILSATTADEFPHEEGLAN